MNRFGVNLLWVSLREYAAGQKLIGHTHADGVYHYIYVVKGEGGIRIGGQSFPFLAGQIYLTAPGIVHAFHSGVKSPLVTVEMKFQLADPELDERVRALPLQMDLRGGNTGSLVWEMWREKEGQKLYYPQIHACQLSHLLCLLQRTAVEMQAGDGLDRESINPAIAYIEEHIGEEITLEKLAEKTHLERVYFAKKFKRVMGVSPMEYVKNVRIERAKEQMVGSDMSITEISRTLGFQTLQHFSAVFQKNTGVSPRMYRRAIRRQ